MQRLCHLLHGEMQPLLTEQLHSLRAHQRIELFLHKRPPLETVFAFPVSILVRKPNQIKRFLHFLRYAEEPSKNCSKMTIKISSKNFLPFEDQYIKRESK